MNSVGIVLHNCME